MASTTKPNDQEQTDQNPTELNTKSYEHKNQKHYESCPEHFSSPQLLFTPDLRICEDLRSGQYCSTLGIYLRNISLRGADGDSESNEYEMADLKSQTALDGLERLGETVKGFGGCSGKLNGYRQ
jgi:hypothetical protein